MNNNTNVVPYIFPVTNQSVRTVIKDGEPWFCLADVCNALEIGNASQVANRLKSNRVISNDLNTTKGIQSLSFVNEPGLYEVIFTSRKPEAVVFKDWVFEEVIPSIRKTGGYGKVPVPELPKPLGVAELLASLPALERLGVIQPNDVRFNQALKDFIYNGMIGKSSNGDDRRWMTCLEIAQMMGYDTYLANKNAVQLGKYVSKQIPDGSPNKAKEQRIYKGTEHPTNIYLVDDVVKGHVKRFMDSLQVVSGHLENNSNE